MKKFQNRRRWRQWLYSRPLAVGLVLLALLLGHSVYLAWQRQQVASQQAAKVADEVAKLEIRRDQLTADLAFLQTDRGVEDKIRRQFSVAKPGEKVVTVVVPPAATGTATTTPSWWGVLGDLFRRWWRAWSSGMTRPSQG